MEVLTEMCVLISIQVIQRAHHQVELFQKVRKELTPAVKIQLTISEISQSLFAFRIGSLTSTLLASKFDWTFIHCNAMNKYILHR